MTAGVGFLAGLVTVALIVTAVCPLILLFLLRKDWRGKTLW